MALLVYVFVLNLIGVVVIKNLKILIFSKIKMKVPLVTALINGIVKAIKALNCKCKSSCCQSECTQSNKRDSPKVGDYSQKIGKLKKVTEL